MRGRLVHLLGAAVLVGALGLTGCTDAGDGRVEATATFDDVADLADGAPVMMADITIGTVSKIELDDSGRRATVSFTLPPIGCPAAGSCAMTVLSAFSSS